MHRKSVVHHCFFNRSYTRSMQEIGIKEKLERLAEKGDLTIDQTTKITEMKLVSISPLGEDVALLQ
jgi:hypothetical protein